MGHKWARLTIAALGLLLCAGTIATYWPVKTYQFINYDDPIYVTENSYVQSGLTWRGIAWAFKTTHGGNWHPLTWLSLMLDKELYDDWAGGFHLTNLLLHTANTLLVFIFLKAMTQAPWRSALVAALFALHPLRVESVAWVAERKDVLSGLFGILTLVLYAIYAKKAKLDSCGRGMYYSLSIIAYGLGLMSKPMLVTWPFLMLLLDYWPLNRLCSVNSFQSRTGLSFWKTLAAHWLRLVPEKIPFFLFAATVSIATYIGQSTAGAMENPRPFGDRLENAFVAYARYLAKTFWPSKLAVFYPFPVGWPIEQVLGAAALLLGVSLCVFLVVRKYPFLFVGWFWFVGTLVPVIGLVQVGGHSMANRYTYLPLIGIFVAFTWGIHHLMRNLKKTYFLQAPMWLGVLVVMSVLTRAQLRHWQNSKELFRYALRVTELNEIAHNNLGVALMADGDIEAAREHFERALQIKPKFGDARVNLGLALIEAGKLEEGLAQLRTATEISPTPNAYYNLGTMLLKAGEYAEAIEYLSRAVALRPTFPQAHLNLGLAEMNAGRLEAASAAFKQALKLKPNWFDAHLNLGTALATQRKFKEAAAHFESAVAIRPNDPTAHFNLANAFIELRRFDDAISLLATCIKLDPHDLQARRSLVILAAGQGMLEKAITNMVKLVELQPDATNAFELANLLLQAGRSEEAVRYYRMALEQNPNWPEICNNLAWILATHPAPHVRNGKEAVLFAERACTLTQRRVPLFLGTLAAAYAEAGRFDEAVRTAEEAHRLAEAQGDTNLAARNKFLLEFYRAGKPYFEQAQKTAATEP